MKRAIVLTAAAILSAALATAGCEQDKDTHSSSSSSSSSSGTGSARGESMQASGAATPRTTAKQGTGTSLSGTTTGNATAAAPTAPRSVASSPPAAPGDATGQTSAAAAPAPASIDQPKPADSSATAAKEVDWEKALSAGAKPAVTSADSVPSAAPPTESSPAADAQPAAATEKKDEHHADAWTKVKPAAAAPKDLQVTGTVKFAKAEHGVKVWVDLKGLKPNGKHGFHIHEKGDLSAADLKTAGPHFNPGGKKHGGPEGEERHGGDLGNLTADDKGNVKTEIMAHGVTIDGEKDGIVGRSVIVHEKADDLKTDPAGDSGARIAGGLIEKAKDSKKSADNGPIQGEAQPAADKQPAAADTATDAAPTDQAKPKDEAPQQELNK